MTSRVKAVLWTGTVGLCLFLLRRALKRRPPSIDVGSVSGDWVAERRGVADQE
jgi:hypothetical protein